MKNDKKNKIAIIGGSGKVGTFLVNHCIEKNFNIRLLLRNPEKFQVQIPNVEIVHGDAKDLNSIKMLVAGCRCVINAVGTTKGEKPLHSIVTQNLLTAMSEHGIKRYIVLTGLVIDAEGDKKGFGTRIQSALMRFLFPEIIADKQKDYRMLTDSQLDWTVVRIPYLDVKKADRKTVVSLSDCKGKSIAGGNLADFLIEQIDSKEYVKKAPFLSN